MIGEKYHGKSKDVRRHTQPNQLVIEFTDRITDQDGLVQGDAHGKGFVACQISKQLFSLLSAHGIDNHYLTEWEDAGIVVEETDALPLEVVVRLIAAGSLLSRVPIQRGERLRAPLVEFYYKNDAWRDPLISERHLVICGICTEIEVTRIVDLAVRAAEVISKRFTACGVDLVDIKFEFGRTARGTTIVIDEISPEVFRAWDASTGESLDKDVFRMGSGSPTKTYSRLFDRLISNEEEG